MLTQPPSVPTAIDYLSDTSLGLVPDVRPSQQRMARHVQRVLDQGGVAVIEAGVAVGKSYAYLLPVLLAEGRCVVIATAKKQLQDQLINKDIPTIAKGLGSRLNPALVSIAGGLLHVATPLKGKSSYACRAQALPIIKKTPDVTYEQFLRTSKYGDRAGYLGHVPRWWGQATAEDCVGKRCRYADDCGYIQLRSDVANSKVVVVNHHVLGADMFFGFGKILGGPYDVLIVDEAHKLIDGIRAAFTVRAAQDSARSIVELVSKTGFAFPAVKRAANRWASLFEVFPHRGDAKLLEAPVFEDNDGVSEVIDAVASAAKEIGGTLELYDNDEDDADVGESVRRDLVVMGQAKRKLEALERGLRTAQGRVSAEPEEDEEVYDQRRKKILNNTAVYGGRDDRGNLHVSCAPISLGGVTRDYFTKVKSVVLCSATLAISGKFTHVSSTLGVTPTVTDVLPSPFDYDAQGFVYVPRDLTGVGRCDAAKIDRVVKLVELSNGGAFVLTTANDDLDLLGDALKGKFPGRVFVQGHGRRPWDGDPQAVLAKFRETQDAVLVGSKAFWEGVDVPGGALRLVVITKLPFPMVNDPIVKARERVADNPFREVGMTDMIIDLRQGVGRLIRSKLDRGCVAILDSRVWTKPYGGAALSALPWSKSMVTSDLSVCEKYLPQFARHFGRRVA